MSQNKKKPLGPPIFDNTELLRTEAGDILEIDSPKAIVSYVILTGVLQRTGKNEFIRKIPFDDSESATLAGRVNSLTTIAEGYHWNGTQWERRQTGSVVGDPASGASPLTIFASAGAGLKRRIFDIHISSSIAGVVVLSDGLGSIRVAAGTPFHIHYGPDGVLQDTAATAITATLATATLEAIAVGNAGE